MELFTSVVYVSAARLQYVLGNCLNFDIVLEISTRLQLRLGYCYKGKNLSDSKKTADSLKTSLLECGDLRRDQSCRRYVMRGSVKANQSRMAYFRRGSIGVNE